MSDAKDTNELRIAQFTLERAAIGILRLSIDGRILWANDFVEQKLGWSRRELEAMTIFDINPTLTPANWAEHIKNFVDRPNARVFESQHRRRSGATFAVEVTVNYLQYEGEQFFIAFVRDLTEQKLAEAERARLQQHLGHAQRMESIGRLAGGVAHDFNNMLTVILGHADLVLATMDAHAPARAEIEEIHLVAQRSADLTRQLLAFARLQVIEPRVLDLNRVVDGMLKMLRRLIGDGVRMSFAPTADLWTVRMDPIQFDQVLVNLVVNARDADAAEVAIATDNVTQGAPAQLSHGELPAGGYVRLTVSDTGRGMTPETLAHAFEPFFTTKEPGAGTGLGLATVFGIVRQNRGAIGVESAPGEGTRFSVYLPRADASPAPEAYVHDVPTGTETVLLVEDDARVRKLLGALLETLGYTVLSAASPAEALAHVEEHGARIEVLVTDLGMPGMNGRELAARVRAALPRVAVVLMSGYLGAGAALADAQTVQKPIGRGELARSVRAAVEQARRAG